MRLLPGLLVVFEGIDGSGKSTQAKLLATHLRSLGYQVVLTHEPSNGFWGQRIRDTSISGRLPVESELTLFYLDRLEHVRDVILPAMASPTIVITDRYYFSNVAYQGSRGFPVGEILEVNEKIAPEPDLLFYLDVPATTAMERVKARDSGNLFEIESELVQSLEIFRGLRRPYLHQLDSLQGRDQNQMLIQSLVFKLIQDSWGVMGGVNESLETIGNGGS